MSNPEFREIWNKVFGEYDPESWKESLEEDCNPEPPLRITFKEFEEGDYEGERNLYIVWYKDQALYIGISESNIWNRWFADSRGCHVFKIGERYRGDYSSSIGRCIIDNFPASYNWIIELRHYPVGLLYKERKELKDIERGLIQKYSPLFNVTYAPELSEKQRELREYLTRKQRFIRLNDPPELLINYDD